MVLEGSLVYIFSNTSFPRTWICQLSIWGHHRYRSPSIHMRYKCLLWLALHPKGSLPGASFKAPARHSFRSSSHRWPLMWQHFDTGNGPERRNARMYMRTNMTRPWITWVPHTLENGHIKEILEGAWEGWGVMETRCYFSPSKLENWKKMYVWVITAIIAILQCP